MDVDNYGYAELCCPFCDKADGCKHLVASFDHENAAIGGGIFFDRENEIAQLIGEHFRALVQAPGWKAPSVFAELWQDFLGQPGEPLDSGLLSHLLDDLLEDTDAIREGGAGIVAYFDRKPAKVYDLVVKAIEQACEVRH